MSSRGVSAIEYVAMENLRERPKRWRAIRVLEQSLAAADSFRVGGKVRDYVSCLLLRLQRTVTHMMGLPRMALFPMFDSEWRRPPSYIIPFKYSRLSDPGKMIRLIVLHPAKSSKRCGSPSPINITLKEVLLNDCSQDQPFVAISYCWGDATDRIKIVCNDCVLTITKSLHDALLQFRTTEERLVWADAICINQRDDEEKSKQVRRMREIYQKAQSVAVWLGEEAADSDRVLHLSEAFGGALRQSSVTNSRDYGDSSVQRALLMTLPPLSESGWSAVGQFLQRPWFGRMWIIQEIAVAQDVVLFCGKSSTRWTSFAELLLFMLAVGLLESHPDSHVEKAVALATTRLHFQNHQRDDFLEMMLKHRPAQATIPKDKIFALCGLLDFPVRPDYTRTDEEVFTDVAIKVINLNSNLDILMVPRATPRSNRMALPSWVPDWTDTPFVMPLLLRPDHLGERPRNMHFQAAGKLDDIAFSPRFSEDRKILIVRGVIIDTIQQVSEAVESAPWSMSISDTIYSDCRFYSTLVKWEKIGTPNQKTRYASGESMRDVYWRTLLAGQISEDETEYHQYQKFRQAWSIWWYVFQLPLPTGLLIWSCWAVGMLTVMVMYSKHRLLKWKISSPGESGDYLRLIREKMLNRRLVRTKRRYLGLVASGARKGDQIALICGCRVPVILRRNDESLEWQFVGDGYIHNIMYGEAFEPCTCEPLKIR